MQRGVFLGVSVKRRWIVGLTLTALAILFWPLLSQTLIQLFFGLIVAMLGLPVMRLLEKRLKPTLAASLSMMSLSAGLIVVLALIVPAVIAQIKQLAALLPALWQNVDGLMASAESWLTDNGITVASLRDQIGTNLSGVFEQAIPGVVGYLSNLAGSVGKVMLAPLFGFYILRDRRQISRFLTQLVPIGFRARTLLTLREIRRELGGFARGQLLISLYVGALTALGLLLCGVPAWLLLGFFMGVMELIPYLGPFLGGVMVLLFALPGGLSRALWALGVVILVQQLEGGMISPGLMSDATRLHPIIVVLCVMLGGMFAGVLGILISVPLVLCLRAAMRTLAQSCNN